MKTALKIAATVAVVALVWLLEQMQQAYEAGKAECKGAI